MSSLFSVNAAGMDLPYGFNRILPLILISKYNTIIVFFTMSFKLVTIRALVCYNPPFFPSKTGTATAVPAVPMALALQSYCTYHLLVEQVGTCSVVQNAV